MAVDGRLSDALNRREPIDDHRGPVGADRRLRSRSARRPGLKAIDPYDLILVLAGETSLPAMSTDEAAAHRIHKVAYDLLLEAPPFRVIGTVYLYPGSDPHRLLDRSTEMFVPVVDARATMGDQPIGTDARRDPRQPPVPARRRAGRSPRPANAPSRSPAGRRQARRRRTGTTRVRRPRRPGSRRI